MLDHEKKPYHPEWQPPTTDEPHYTNIRGAWFPPIEVYLKKTGKPYEMMDPIDAPEGVSLTFLVNGHKATYNVWCLMAYVESDEIYKLVKHVTGLGNEYKMP